MEAKRARQGYRRMWPRVAAKKALASAAAKERVRAALRELSQTQLFALVMRQVRAESGVWLREGHAWPRPIRRAAENAFAIADLLMELVRETDVLGAAELPDDASAAFEARWLGLLQALLDGVTAEANDRETNAGRALAGMVGSGDGLEALHVSSGVEAASRLAWCLRRWVLLGSDNVFAPYVLSAGERRAMRKQVDRDRPRSSRELHSDDVAILRACAGGPLPAKIVASRCNLGGRSLSVSHVTKRKTDLRRWGLLTLARAFELSPTGRVWREQLDHLDNR